MPVGARLSAPIETGPEAHPASYTMGTGSFLGVTQLECGVDHPLLSSAKVKERVELCLYSPSGPSWPVRGWTLLYSTLPYFVVYFLGSFERYCAVIFKVWVCCLQAFHSLAKCVAALTVTWQQEALTVVEQFLRDVQNPRSDAQHIFALLVIGEIGRHM